MEIATQPKPASPLKSNDVWIIVRAYNEAKVIGSTLEELRRGWPNVIVVDDGSSDATTEEALAAGAQVVRHPLNLGAGAALQTGLKHALAMKAAVIATFDADGQHHAEDLHAMVATLQNEHLDIVLGSRFAGRTEGLPPLRRSILRAATVFTALTTGVRLSDAHNGMRVMTRKTAQRIDLHQDRYAYASELVSQIAGHHLRYKEVPVTITYTAYSLEKGQKLSNSFRILADLFIGWLLR